MTKEHEESKNFEIDMIIREDIQSYLDTHGDEVFIIAGMGVNSEYDPLLTQTQERAFKERKMAVSAMRKLLVSTSWITTQDLKTLQNSALGHSNDPNDWERLGLIFSIEMYGVKLFPFYALNPDLGYFPVKILMEILGVFSDQKSSNGIAFWFAAVCGFLGGKRPQDLLRSHPELVLAAAKDAVLGITHG